MSRLRAIFAVGYAIVGIVLLAGIISHSAWYFARFEQADSEGYGLLIAVALDLALAITAAAQIALRLRGEDVPLVLRRLFWLLIAVSFATNFVHADGNNALDRSGLGHYLSALLASLPLPAALFGMIEIAVALLAGSEQALPARLPASETGNETGILPASLSSALADKEATGRQEVTRPVARIARRQAIGRATDRQRAGKGISTRQAGNARTADEWAGNWGIDVSSARKRLKTMQAGGQAAQAGRRGRASLWMVGQAKEANHNVVQG